MKSKKMMNSFVTSLTRKPLMKMELQYFADGSGDGADGSGSGEGSSGGEDKPISFANQSEFDSVVDKRITKAIETAQVKWQTESENALRKLKVKVRNSLR